MAQLGYSQSACGSFRNGLLSLEACHTTAVFKQQDSRCSFYILLLIAKVPRIRER